MPIASYTFSTELRMLTASSGRLCLSLLKSLNLTPHDWQGEMGCYWDAKGPRGFYHPKYSFMAREDYNSTPSASLKFPTVCTLKYYVKLETFQVGLKWHEAHVHFPQFLVCQGSHRKPRHPWQAMSPNAQLRGSPRITGNVSLPARNSHTSEDRFADRRQFKTWVTYIFTIDSY